MGLYTQGSTYRLEYLFMLLVCSPDIEHLHDTGTCWKKQELDVAKSIKAKLQHGADWENRDRRTGLVGANVWL